MESAGGASSLRIVPCPTTSPSSAPTTFDRVTVKVSSVSLSVSPLTVTSNASVIMPAAISSPVSDRAT